MNHFDMMLASRSFTSGRGLRSSSLRHRRLVGRPMALVVWQMAGEPFSAAALGWGCKPTDLSVAVAGEPRNRALAFDTLRALADWFNPHFEAPANERETIEKPNYSFTRATTAPQVLVANGATVTALGHLGRWLAYLPTKGGTPADPALVRLGRHLSFLYRQAAVPGQQLIVSMTDLLNDHWMTAQSELERQSLAALDAWIEPPAGMHGFCAAAAAEEVPVGPVPPGECDQKLEPLVTKFNELRGDGADPVVVEPLLGPIIDHYRPLIEGAWDLLWRCRNREARFGEAPSVARRWAEDRQAYTRHIDWLKEGGLRRTRQTARQAALTLNRLEEALELLEAEQACDDPLRMIPYLLANQAVRGVVIAIDHNHKEKLKVTVARPLVTLRSPDPCLMPVGKKLWWTEKASGTEYLVHKVAPAPGGGSLVTLKLMTRNATEMPAVGAEACFSIHRTKPGFFTQLPKTEPWTHVASGGAGPESIDE